MLIESHQYGVWMQAPPFNPAKKSMVVIPGFYKKHKFELNQPTTGGLAPSSGHSVKL